MLADSGIDILRKEKYGQDREFTLCGVRDTTEKTDAVAGRGLARKTTSHLQQERKDKKKQQHGDEQLIEGYVVLYKVTARGGMQ
jgi:hypothetical protein